MKRDGQIVIAGDQTNQINDLQNRTGKRSHERREGNKEWTPIFAH